MLQLLHTSLLSDLTLFLVQFLQLLLQLLNFYQISFIRLDLFAKFGFQLLNAIGAGLYLGHQIFDAIMFILQVEVFSCVLDIAVTALDDYQLAIINQMQLHFILQQGELRLIAFSFAAKRTREELFIFKLFPLFLYHLFVAQDHRCLFFFLFILKFERAQDVAHNSTNWLSFQATFTLAFLVQAFQGCWNLYLGYSLFL